MSIKRTGEHGSKVRRRRVFQVERLEQRALLAVAAATFNGPSLNDLIQLALAPHDRQNTAPAAIERMLQALETQLESGPLADLKAGTVTGSEFVTEVQNLETSYAANVDQQLSPQFPNVDKLLKLSGERIVADVTSLNQQNSVGLITNAALQTQAQTAIDSLTGGPLFPLHTPLSAFVSTTQNFETGLNTVVGSLSASATPHLTLAQVNTTLQSEATAYQADLDAALLVTHPNIAGMVDAAVTTLKTTSSTIAQQAPTDAQTQLQAAITAFDAALLDTTGLFGPSGIISQSLNHDQNHDSD